jgi:hypothetical protein
MANFIGNLTDYPVVTPAGADTIPIIQGGVQKQATVQAAGGVAVAAHVAETDPHAQYLTQAEADLLYAGSPAPTGNVLSSGGGVAWLGDYDYRVSAANYILQGTAYNSAQADLTLDASDATLDRIDIIALTTSGPVILKGTDSATPAAPDVDPSTHLALTFVYVAATTTAPTATREDVYLENTEWTSSSSGATWALASTNNPLSGTVDIEGTSLAAAAYVQLEKPSGTINPSDYDNLVLYVRSKATWAAAKSLAIRLLNAGVQVGSAVTVKTGVFGFDSSVTSNYQQIVIPLAIFGAGSLAVNQLRLTVTGGGGSIGFYLDDISLQAGVSLATPTDALRYRGAYNASAQYQRFDVVYTGSGSTLALWVVLQPVVGVTPAAGVYYDRLTPTGGSGDALVANPLSQFAATTSAQLAGVISDETGSGALVFGTSPTLVTPALGTPSALVLTNATGLPLTSGVTGVLPVANFATGTPDGTKFVRDDGVLAVPSAGSVDADDVTYTPTTLADWDGAADPGDVEQALDQLAERTADLEGAGAVDAAAVTYTPTTAADWDGGTDPGSVDDALDQLAERVADIESAGASPAAAGRYVIDLASQSDGDPGPGKLRFNHATPTSATKIFLDDETSDGVDMSTALLDIGSTGYIRIQSVDDVGEWLYAKWTAIVDDTGYFDIAITVLASKGTLDDTDAVLVTFDAKGSGGAGSAGRHAVYIAAGAMQPALSAGSSGLTPLSVGASQPEIATLNFDATTQESAHFSLTMPKSWDEGTVTFVPIWSHASTTTNFGVVWSLRGVAFSNDDTMAASFGTAQTSTDTGGTTNDLYVGPESSAMTIGGSPAAEDTVFFRVDRVPTDGGDTMAIDARLHGIVLFITTDAETDA